MRKRHLMAVVTFAIEVVLVLALAAPAVAQDDDDPEDSEYPPATCSLALNKSVAEHEETVLASTVNCQSGYDGGATVTFELVSTPIFLTTATASDDGTFSNVPFVVPEQATEGPHTVRATGPADDGGTLVLTAPLRVIDDPDGCEDEEGRDREECEDDEDCDEEGRDREECEDDEDCDEEGRDREECEDDEDCDDAARDSEECEDDEDCDDEASDQEAGDREECDQEDVDPPASAGSGGDPGSARAAGATSTARNGGGSGNLAFTGSDSLPLLWLALVLLTIGTAFVLAARRRAQVRRRITG